MERGVSARHTHAGSEVDGAEHLDGQVGVHLADDLGGVPGREMGFLRGRYSVSIMQVGRYAERIFPSHRRELPRGGERRRKKHERG